MSHAIILLQLLMTL